MNITFAGFYRVNYDKENWWKISEYLKSNDYSKIHPINRAQLLYDVFRIYQDDQSYLEILVSITSYLHQETDYLPWIPASNIIMEMLENMRNTPEEDLFKTHILFLTSEITDKLGFENGGAFNPPAVRIRSKLAPLLCEFGHADCRSFSQHLFNKLLEDPLKNT